MLSGLDISGADNHPYDLRLTLLVEWLMGESASEAVRTSRPLHPCPVL